MKVIHLARLLWHGNLTQKRLTTAIVLLVHNDFWFLGFLRMFQREDDMELFILRIIFKL